MIKFNLLKMLQALVLFSVDGGGGGGGEPAAEPTGGEPTPAPTGGEGNKPTDGDDGEPAPAPDEGNDVVPENYAEFTMPDGVAIDKQYLDHFSPIMKDVELTQDKAQKLATGLAEFVTAREKEAADNYQSDVDDWVTEVKADKDLGGDNYTETQRLSAAALDKVGTPELSTFLDTFGIGSHPEIVRLLAKVGSMVVEDNPTGGNPATGSQSRAERMYGKS